MNRVLIVFVSLFFFFTFLCAQNTTQQNIVSQNVSGFGVFVDKELIQLIDLVKEKRYVVSLDVLEFLSFILLANSIFSSLFIF